MRPVLIREGDVFSRLTAIRRIGTGKYGAAMWLFQCSCGNQVTTRASSARIGKSKSCGCFYREAAATRLKTHGMSQTGVYSAWRNMLRRCSDPRDKDYHKYGARGIKVCDRWLDFSNFIADMGARPPGMTLDRWPNNDGNYEPGNARWATVREQNNNTRKNVHIEAFGKRQTMAQWAREVGMPPSKLRQRILNGWAPEIAISQN